MGARLHWGVFNSMIELLIECSSADLWEYYMPIFQNHTAEHNILPICRTCRAAAALSLACVGSAPALAAVERHAAVWHDVNLAHDARVAQAQIITFHR